MKISYSVEHLRRLQKMPTIELRPLTLLVGRNSAGKSTFLRSLPLLRQSIETRTSAPILWYGDYVDFGDFETAVSSKGEDREAAFTFTLHDLKEDAGVLVSFDDMYVREFTHKKIEVKEATAKYIIGADENKTVLKRIELNIADEKIRLCIDHEKTSISDGQVTLDGKNLGDLLPGYKLAPHDGNIFSSSDFKFLRKAKDKDKNDIWRNISTDMMFFKLLEGIFKRKSQRVGEKRIRNEVSRLLSSDQFDRGQFLKLQKTSSTETFQKHYHELRTRPKSKFSTDVLQILQMNRAFQTLEIFKKRLPNFFSGVSYLGPARAAGERFYRKQELEISEIASNGANFPMFLASLPKDKLEEFSTSVESIFGFGVEIQSSTGHISINLKTGGRDVNITDTGYGVGQILPVLGAVWWAGRQPPARGPRPFYRRPPQHHIRTLAIEQPELHLHPAHQAKLADVFASAIANTGKPDGPISIRFVIETHSEALINRLGELVAKGEIAAKDVQIVIFDAQDDMNSPTKVSTANYDDAGVLSNWPYGFFNYGPL